MTFSTLHVKEHGVDEWQLTRVLVWVGDFEGTHYIIKCHEGFITDLASIPRVARPLFPVNGRHRRAAVIHDYHYVYKTVPPRVRDGLFYLHMKELGVPRWRAKLMFYAVRAYSILSGK